MIDRKKRILLVIDEATIGGGQRHVLSIASRLNPDAFAVAVVCEAEGYLVDELRRHGIEHYPVAMSNIPDPFAIAHCVRAIREYRADLVHTHGGTAGVTGRIASFLCGVPSVHTYHGIHYLHDSRGLRRWGFGAVERVLLYMTNRVICVAARDAETGERAGIVDPAKTTVILNGIDTSAFPGKAAYRFQDIPVLGTIGRLHEQKGHRILLESLALLRRDGRRFRCVIVGEGELREQLESQSMALGLGEAVEFAGGRTDTAAHLAGMDLFLLPSLWEGLPLVLEEAMASGLPIVATRVDGIEEAVRDGREALLVLPGDVVGLKEAIGRLLDDEVLRSKLGKAARHRAVECFDVTTMVRSTEAVYRSVLQ
jgi:glycosyltransferase involved in cell wall biosynthesis